MKIIELNEIQNISEDINLQRVYVQFGELLQELREKDFSDEIIASINVDVAELNSTSVKDKALVKLVKKKQGGILRLLEKELKIVPKNYYRNLWLVLGMSAFGLPLGVAFGVSMGNIGLLAIGIPIGMVVGMAVGSRMDKKALEEGRQLDVELKY